MKNSHNLLLLLITSILFISCSKEDGDTITETNPTNTDVTYSDISGIIENRCLECHGIPTTNQAEISLTTYESLREAAENRNLTGRLKSFNNQMPPQPDSPLSVAQIELIEGWVLGGYKE